MHYTDSTITWQAYNSMIVNQDCLNSGYFFNGKKLNAKDIEDAKEQIEICKGILTEHGVEFELKTKGQLQLF